MELEIQNEELKRSQQELSELHKKYVELHEFAPCGYVTLSPKGIISDINLTGVRLLGSERTRLYHCGLSQFVTKEHQGEYFAALKRAEESGEQQVLEFKLNRENQPVVWVRAEIIADFAKSGEVRQWRLAVMDITERVREQRKREKLFKELEDREALLSAIFENTPVGIVVCDEKARITMTNPAADKLSPQPAPIGQEVGSHSRLRILQQDDTPYDPHDLPLSRSALRGEYCQHEEVRIQWPTGEKRWLLVNTAPVLGEDGRQSGAVGLFDDITERKKGEQALRASEQSFRQLFEQAAIGIFIVRRDHTIMQANQTALAILGYSREEVLRMNVWDLVHPEILKKYPPESTANKLLSGKTIHVEQKFRLKEGGYIEVLVNLARMPYSSEKDSYMVMFQDISERKRMEEQLRQLSLYDSLTGLYNRTFFDLEMERLSDRRYMPAGIVMCDLDGLKFVNDTLGHSSGDEMLSSAAAILRRCVRSSEIVARVGGDEFAILLPNINEEVIHELLQRLRREEENFNAGNPSIPVSLSIGYVVGSTEGTDMEVLFREADNRMYREKAQKEQSSRNAIVRGLIKALEARDFLMEGHSERLQQLVASLARAIDLPGDRINDLRLFARFHDLGKVGVHDQILFKPGSLTEDEAREMRKHCEVGHRIAMSLHDMAPIADWILKHHERWDGLGYPFGLQGREIPLECRILAIADAFDVMTSDRPYQNAISPSEAVEELRRCSGTQFDPDLVEEFIRILDIQDTE
jgi:diguanylate cyclase (GGDEF)-like protein/PAS domain S-box-containing protein